ncbi:MAG: hypothetical protein JXA72_14230 [Bacteroidales bacterium]|nr:hypothetical protein [Bacteroidales bacterium]
MKQIVMLSFALLMIMGNMSCNAQVGKKESTGNKTAKVEAYYFHFAARCVTCKAVEAEAKSSIENLYGGKVTFQSVNLDEDSSKVLAEKLKVDGQSLLIVKGDTKINLTNEGFMYARNNPEKFKAIIKEKVDALIQ